MKNIVKAVKLMLAAFVAFALPATMQAEITGEKAGVKNNLVTMFNYQKGMMTNIFNAENDKMTYMIAGKYWRVAYKGKDGSEITETEYRYNSTTGAMEAVYNAATNTMTLYDGGKSAMDVTVRQGSLTASQFSTLMNKIKASKSGGKYVIAGLTNAEKESVTVTARYDYDSSGVMKAKTMYGYVGEANTTAATEKNPTGVSNSATATASEDVDGDNVGDDGYAVVQSMTFKDGKQSEVKSHWVQDSNHNWVYKGDAKNLTATTADDPVTTTLYIWNGNELAAVLSGDSVTKNTDGSYSGATSVMLYKAGKEDCTFKIDEGTQLTVNAGKISVRGVATGIDGTLDGSKTRITADGSNTTTSTQLAVKSSQNFYVGIKKIYTAEFNTDSETVNERGTRMSSKTVFDTHGRSTYSVNYKEGKVDALGKVWKYNDTIDGNKRQFTFDMAGIEIKQKTDANNNPIAGASLLTICGQTIELACSPADAAQYVNALSVALSGQWSNGATATTTDINDAYILLTSLKSDGSTVPNSTEILNARAKFGNASLMSGTQGSSNKSALSTIKGMFTKMGKVSFDFSTKTDNNGTPDNTADDKGVTVYSANISGIEDQVTYNPGSTQYVVDFSNVKTSKVKGPSDLTATNKTVATVNITYMDENGQQQAQFQTMAILNADGSFTALAGTAENDGGTPTDVNDDYITYADSAIETWSTDGSVNEANNAVSD